MKSISFYKKKTPNSPDKNDLSKIKIGLILVLIGSYFVFSDTLGASLYIDHFKVDYTPNSFHAVYFPFLKLNGTITISLFLYCIALFLFCWDIFDFKMNK